MVVHAHVGGSGVYTPTQSARFGVKTTLLASVVAVAPANLPSLEGKLVEEMSKVENACEGRDVEGENALLTLTIPMLDALCGAKTTRRCGPTTVPAAPKYLAFPVLPVGMQEKGGGAELELAPETSSKPKQSASYGAKIMLWGPALTPPNFWSCEMT